MPLDRSVDEFRDAGHRLVDWIAEYLQNPDAVPVLSQVVPGQIAQQFEAAPLLEGTSYAELMRQFEEKILPGITHWNHPAFFAYFAITGSHAGILGEFLSAALNLNGMLWKTSPAATELEEVCLGWLRDALGFPSTLFGIINDTASINSFLALAAAREKLDLGIRTEGMTGRELPQLRIYCSDQAHSSIDKAALALGFGTRGLVKIESDEAFRMKPEALAGAIAADRSAGAVPTAVVATLGTTSTASIDPLEEIAAITAREGVWLHVDAAYGGSAAIIPDLRGMLLGIEHADSVVVNPHKWLFTPVDCSVLFTRSPEILKRTFSLVPEYLKTAQDTEVINYMDYGLQLGRRFRALKLWMVLEHYGLDRIRETIREHIGFAARLASELAQRGDVELLAPQSLSVVVFRMLVRRGGTIDEEASERATEALLDRINSSGKLFLSHTKLRGKFGIRVAIGNGATEWRHVEQVLGFL